jgi:hypothetical protein
VKARFILLVVALGAALFALTLADGGWPGI